MDDPDGVGDTSGMMDGMDDLFGEDAAQALGAADLGPENLHMALPPAPQVPPPSQVIQRIHEMQTFGCCTKLVWSSTGAIAHISQDGRNVQFHVMNRHAKTGSYTLTEALNHSCKAPEESPPFVHLAFSGLSLDMAVFDALGGVHIFNLSGAIGRMLPATGLYSEHEGQRTELDRVVGSYWLPVYPTEFRSPWISPATKIDDTDHWATHMNVRDLNRPRVHHPADGRGALLYVTCNGRLYLSYQQEGYGWFTTSTDLEGFAASNELMSHAAFGEDGDKVLLATHDHGKGIKLYSVRIKWNASQDTVKDMHVTKVRPEFEIGHLTALQHVSPEQSDAATAQLSILKIVPAVSESAEPAAPTHPTIMALFTHAAHSFSVLSRWHAELISPTLHESFGKLKGNKTASADLGSSTILRRQADILTTKLVVSIDSQIFDTILAFGHSDGTTDFRDRVTMTTIDGFGDTRNVSSLSYNGFEQLPAEHSLHLALSPDGSAVAHLPPNSKLQTKAMQQRFGWHPLDNGINDSRGMVEAAVVCLARQYAILSCSNLANDETLALLPTELDVALRRFFVQQIITITSRNPDIALQEPQRQQMQVLKEPLLPRALSAQVVLGTKQGSSERTLTGQLAWIILNLKLVCTSLVQSVSRQEMGKFDTWHSMRGLVKWALHLHISIVNELLEIWRSRNQHDSVKAVFEAHLAGTESPAIHLLLCSFSRAFLRFQTMYIPKYLMGIPQCMPRAQSVAQRQQLQDVQDLAENSPVKLQVFNQILLDIDNAIRRTYTENNIDSSRRTAIELGMLTEGSVPDEITPVLQQMMDSTLPKTAENVDVGGVYFCNTSWLDLANSHADGKSGTKYDVVRKTPLPKNAKVRFCRRCGSETEDFSPEELRTLPVWMRSADRHCVCTNYWVLA